LGTEQNYRPILLPSIWQRMADLNWKPKVVAEIQRFYVFGWI
jgi:hypothetical protein